MPSLSACSDKNKVDSAGLSDDLLSQSDHQLRSVVPRSVHQIKLPYAVVVVASQWPYWLIPVLSLRLPLAGAFFPRHLHKY